MEGIRATLIEKREALQMSRNQLAKLSGVSYNLVKKFEDGEDIINIGEFKAEDFEYYWYAPYGYDPGNEEELYARTNEYDCPPYSQRK